MCINENQLKYSYIKLKLDEFWYKQHIAILIAIEINGKMNLLIACYWI